MFSICRGQEVSQATDENAKSPQNIETIKKSAVHLYAESSRVAASTAPKSGILIKFDRPSGAVYRPGVTTYKVSDQYTDEDLPVDFQRAINGSSVLLSGTLFKSDQPVPRCAASDWTITALARESSGVIIYRPGDVSVYCDLNPPKGTVLKPGPPSNSKAGPPTLGNYGYLYAVLPVDADWIQLTGFIGDLNDPARKMPGAISTAPTYCWTLDSATKYANASEPTTSIVPCDLAKGTNAVRKAYYHSGWIYNRLTAPGVWAGSFSLAPVVVSGKSQSLTEDILFSGSSKEGPGWLALTSQFEKSSTAAGNLNSLTGTLTYKLRLAHSTRRWWHVPQSLAAVNAPDGAYVETNASVGIGIRPGELMFSGGEEYAVTRPTMSEGMRGPKDLNVVEGIYYRQPISITARSYPSLLTFFPTFGTEGGWHLIRYLPESAHFFRKVVGADASLRWPYQVAPNFTSTKAATIDFTFRERLLSGDEPYTNIGGASPMAQLTRRGRQYMRIGLNWPLSSFVSITTSVQHGGLPPDFDVVAWTFTLGLSFASSGTAEH